jgi:peptidoglycan/xylan/chitin deacetylase (PgdA/CDA1 family)
MSKSRTNGLAAFVHKFREAAVPKRFVPGTNAVLSGNPQLGLTVSTLRNVAGRLSAPLLRPLGQPVALFFHGVERGLSDSDLEANHHAVENFHVIATALKAHFEVAPLSELGVALARPERHRQTVFLMSDDGYANTLNTAADALQDLSLPWALFVSTQHIESGEPNPMVIANLFSQRAPDGTYNLPHLPEPIRLNGSRSFTMVQLRESIRFLPARSAKETVGAIRTILQEHDVSLPDSERFLNWDGVRALHARGVTIGAHAHWHWALHRNEDPDFLQRQAQLPKLRIEAELAVSCRYFAYPFGNARDVSREAWRAVCDAGYDYGFTTMTGTLAASTNPWLLPRYGLAPKEPNLRTMLPLLRAGNPRVKRWQRALT